MLCHAKSLQSCPTLCDPTDGSTPGSPVPGILQARKTGVGCHFLLQCMRVKRESEVAQSCPTPSDSMDCSPPGSSIHGMFQARVLEWGAIAFSEPLSQCQICYAFPNAKSYSAANFSIKEQLSCYNEVSQNIVTQTR